MQLARTTSLQPETLVQPLGLMVRPGHVRAPLPVIEVPLIAIQIFLYRVNAERCSGHAYDHSHL